MSVFTEPRVHECYYCKLTHKDVEAGGMYYCPNVLCQGPGACRWREGLSSYDETGDDGRHTVDHREALIRGLAHAFEIEKSDPALAAKIRETAPKWGELSSITESVK